MKRFKLKYAVLIELLLLLLWNPSMKMSVLRSGASNSELTSALRNSKENSQHILNSLATFPSVHLSMSHHKPTYSFNSITEALIPSRTPIGAT